MCTAASALAALAHTITYLAQTKHLCIAQRLCQPDVDVSFAASSQKRQEDQLGFEFYTDSDHAGNNETQNRRRSQNGYCAKLHDATVDWMSKVSSVAFATPLIGEAHPDMSSGAAKIYAASVALTEVMHLAYIVEEMGGSMTV